MSNITITLTATQYKGLEYIALSPEDWVENAATERARIAVDEIVDATVKYCLDNDVTLPSTREAIVTYAFDNDVVQTASERQAAMDAQEAP